MLYIGKEVTVTDAMVTGRMPERKKQQGLRVLKRDGMNASQAVNLLFDRLIEGERRLPFARWRCVCGRAVGIGGALCR